MKLDYVLKFEDFLEHRMHTEVRDQLVEMSFDLICCAGRAAGRGQGCGVRPGQGLAGVQLLSRGGGAR